MANIQDTLSKMYAAGKFEPYIRYIRFPHFRNLREGLRIDFSHPITALVGPNGTNKTAILRALQGCPDYYNVGNYWFETDLDRIGESQRHRFIHAYKLRDSDEIVEVIKTRIQRGENPDYFEPSRPLLQDGMAKMPDLKPGDIAPPERRKSRWKAISKKVIYLDFRSELSAYDKYFFHVPLRGGTSPLEKKKSIRRRSGHLNRSIETGRSEHSYYGHERIIKAARFANSDQLKAISEILGREYESVKLIRHRYYDVEGSTVVLKASGLAYSEAFAGSGEFAVCLMVINIMEADPASLILLDEPEVSLHPGAQRKLMRFVSEQAKLNLHQVIVSTHSPEIISDLPNHAIKVFLPSQADGHIDLVSQGSVPTEAFFRLGVRPSNKKTIYVEDGLAQEIVQRAVRTLGEAIAKATKIMAIPGGANTIQTRFIPAFALADVKNCLVLLDGDQRPQKAWPSSTKILDEDLEKTVTEYLGGKPQLSPNGSAGSSAPTEKKQQLRQIIDWCGHYVDYLPGTDPERLLLDLGHCVVGANGSKGTWKDRTVTALGKRPWEDVSSVEILIEQQRFLASISDSDPVLARIAERIKDLFHNQRGTT